MFMGAGRWKWNKNDPLFGDPKSPLGAVALTISLVAAVVVAVLWR